MAYSHSYSRHPPPLQESSTNIPHYHQHQHHQLKERNINANYKMNNSSSASTSYVSQGQYDEHQSDSESSASPSPHARGRCFCGRPTESGGIYCSVDCARSDAFSSLCYKPTPSSTPHTSISLADQQLTVAAISAALSRNPSTSSAHASTSTSSSSHETDWNASHYRRLARADIRRDERKEERKRRRAEGSLASSISRSTIMSTSSSASRAVPDLIGGHSHSRNPSIASSITSLSSSTWGSGSSLSRNPSSASTSSRRGYGNNFSVDAAIMEDDDEEEWLQSEISRPYVPTVPSSRPQMKRRDSRSQSSSSSRKGKKGTPDPLPFGMGKDMRDVLEEIIQMEKSFLVSDNEIENDDDASMMAPAAPGLFTSQFERPPRTPSPVVAGRKRSLAPGAPMRGHRSAHSQPNIHASPTHQPAPGPPPIAPTPQRPPSLMGLHQSSLSESHTALYLATASPVTSGRRSCSPKLETRKSLTFTPDAAGPSISLGGLPLPRYNFDTTSSFSSPNMNLTPRRRNITPSAKHPTMDHWRFPSPANRGLGTTSAMATPTKQSQAQFPNADPFALATEQTDIEPALLWPPPPNLQPSLFPCSPANGTPEFEVSSSMMGRLPRSDSHPMMMSSGIGESPDLPTNGRISAPGSGLRLGVLLGSGDDNDDDDDMEVDDGSTEHGHSNGNRSRGTGFLPVFLEAEGFRASDGARGW